MVREFHEEIGLAVDASSLHYLGISRRAISHRGLCDHEFARVFLLWDPSPDFHPGEEVATMIRVPLDQWLARLDGAPSIEAYAMDGTPLTVREDQWAGVPTDFYDTILPALQEEAPI